MTIYLNAGNMASYIKIGLVVFQLRTLSEQIQFNIQGILLYAQVECCIESITTVAIGTYYLILS